MLTDRRKQLLRHIVEEYVDTAQPVGSRTLVDKYELPLSPATIRNEMAALEDEGLVERAATMRDRLGTGLRDALGDHVHATNIRQLGLMPALSLVHDPASAQRYAASGGAPPPDPPPPPQTP